MKRHGKQEQNVLERFVNEFFLGAHCFQHALARRCEAAQCVRHFCAAFPVAPDGARLAIFW